MGARSSVLADADGLGLCSQAVSLLGELDAFFTEHCRCGELHTGLDGPIVWMACDCGASMARRADEDDQRVHDYRKCLTNSVAAADGRGRRRASGALAWARCEEIRRHSRAVVEASRELRGPGQASVGLSAGGSVGRSGTALAGRETWEPAMLDDAYTDSPCDDSSHRILYVTAPYAEAKDIRARLINALGAARVSRLRRVEGGWEIVLCGRCIGDERAERLAG